MCVAVVSKCPGGRGLYSIPLVFDFISTSDIEFKFTVR